MVADVDRYRLAGIADTELGRLPGQGTEPGQGVQNLARIALPPLPVEWEIMGDLEPPADDDPIRPAAGILRIPLDPVPDDMLLISQVEVDDAVELIQQAPEDILQVLGDETLD